MRASLEDYEEIETEQKALLGSNSKHIIARETAKHVALDVESVGQQRLLEVIERIKAME